MKYLPATDYFFEKIRYLKWEVINSDTNKI